MCIVTKYKYFIIVLYSSIYNFLLSLPTSEHKYLNFLLLTCSKQAFACSLKALEGNYLIVLFLHHCPQDWFQPIIAYQARQMWRDETTLKMETEFFFLCFTEPNMCLFDTLGMRRNNQLSLWCVQEQLEQNPYWFYLLIFIFFELYWYDVSLS